MIVENTGYISVEQIKALAEQKKSFGIYKTKKGTLVLLNCKYIDDAVNLCRPKLDRLPWKYVNGRKIADGKLVFDSNKDDITTFDFSQANMGNQVMSYASMEYAHGF